MHKFVHEITFQTGVRDSIERKIVKPRWYTGVNINAEKQGFINAIKYIFKNKPEQAQSYNDLRHTMLKSLYGSAKTDFQGGGVGGGNILKLVRKLGKLSAEIDGQMVAYLRELMDGGYNRKYGITDDELFIDKLRALSVEKAYDLAFWQEQFRQYAELTSRAREIEEKHDSAIPITNEEKEYYLHFKEFQTDIGENCPLIVLFLHFYDNGDLKWLWGLRDSDTTLEAVRDKSEGGRVGDPDNEQW